MRNKSELDERPQTRREWSGLGRSLVFPLAVLALIIGALFYFQTRSASNGGDDGFGSVALPAGKNVSGSAPAAEVGRAAPDFLLRTLDGGTLRLSDLQGHPLLVNFWASWCLPCREETPGLIAAYEQNKATGLLVIGVNLQEADERAHQFANDFSIDYLLALDRRGEVARTWRIGGPMQGLPETYFIDPRGIVQKVVLGPVRPNDLRDGLALIASSGS